LNGPSLDGGDALTGRRPTTGEGRKGLVERGYDLIAVAYAAARTQIGERDAEYVEFLGELLSPGARVLDLGCGAGVGITQALAARYRVTGVDLSREQLKVARKAVPNATFLRGDMTTVAFRKGSFDAITSFAAMIHVPREEHRTLFRHVHRWLRPGGILLVTLGTDDGVSSDDDRFMGVPMYWSQFDARTARGLVRDSGFRILRSSIERGEFLGEPEEHLYVLAAKSGARRGRGAPDPRST